MHPTGSDPARLTTLVWQPDGGAAALRPDGRELVTGGNDGALALWNVPTGRLVRTWQAHRGWVWASSYHPKPRRASGGRHHGEAGSLSGEAQARQVC